jgi:hypothetical protein
MASFTQAKRSERLQTADAAVDVSAGRHCGLGVRGCAERQEWSFAHLGNYGRSCQIIIPTTPIRRVRPQRIGRSLERDDNRSGELARRREIDEFLRLQRATNAPQIRVIVPGGSFSRS